jgi:hypothetical protein
VIRVTVQQIAARHSDPKSTARYRQTTSRTMKCETPKLSDAELDKVTGGSMMSMLSRLIQAKSDMQKGIIANFRV